MTTPDPSELDTLPPTAAVPPRPLGSGYLLLEPVGAGATGRVWRARRRSDDATVAVKVLREDYLRDPDAVTRFLREGATLRAVEHPHLVRVLDLVAEGDTLAIVMDFVDGEDLRAMLGAGPLDADRGVTVLAQLAAALSAVHAAGIVHRDVKPENALVVSRGGGPWTRLTDFGLARIIDGPAVTRSAQLVGTPAYVAPELVAGRQPGPAVDVYALGVTGYELLAGYRPFQADSAAALLRAHLDTEPARPAQLSDPVWALLRGCLAKDPADRPSAAELAAGFEAILGPGASLPVGAPPPVPPAPAVGPRPSPSPVSTVDVPAAAPIEAWQPEARQPTAARQLTEAASRPVPAAPEPPATRRRRWPLVFAAAVLALLAVVAGVWAGRPHGGPAPAATRSGPAAQLVYLPVTATSPRAGTVRLDFGDASNLPGFDSYVVFRDDTRLDQVLPGQAPPYLVPDVDARTVHCYRVAALVVSDAPTPPAAKPACLAADGKSAPTRS